MVTRIANGKLRIRNMVIALALAGVYTAPPSDPVPTDPAPGGNSSSITLVELPNQMIAQRVGTSKSIPVGYTTPGAPGTAVEARVINAANAAVTNWTSVGTTGADATGSGSIVVPQGSWYRLQVRVAGSQTLVTTAANKFGVGMIILLVGQSNMVNVGGSYYYPSGSPNLLQYLPGTTPKYARCGNINDAYPPSSYFGSGTGKYGTYTNEGAGGDLPVFTGNELVAALGIPVCYVNTAVGGKSIWSFLPSRPTNQPDCYTQMVDTITAMGGDFELALWLQGESDAHTMTQAVMVEKLGVLHSTFKTINGRTDANFKLGIIALGAGSYSGSTDGEFGNMRLAHIQYATTTPGAFLAGCGHDCYTSDGVHWQGASYGRIGMRVATTVKAAVTGSAPLAGPRIASATRSGLNVTVNVTHSGGTALTDGVGGAGAALMGFQFFDDGAGGAEIGYNPATSIVGDTIRLTLNSAPVGALRMSHAMRNAPFDAGNSATPVPTYAGAVHDNVAVIKSTIGMILQPCAPISVTGS